MPEQHVLCLIVSQLHHVLGQHVPVREDVAQLGAPVTEDLAHKEPAMAIARLSAAAQQRYAMLGCAVQNPVDRFAEDGLRGHPVVQGMAFGIELIFAPGAPAERRAQKCVANATRFDRTLQLIAVEVRRVARVRMGPYIHEMRDLVALHQGEECSDIVV